MNGNRVSLRSDQTLGGSALAPKDFFSFFVSPIVRVICQGIRGIRIDFLSLA